MRSEGPEFALVVDAWFDGETQHRGRTTLLVREGRIEDIEPGDHAADLERRGVAVRRGAFLMPGLVDAHAHLFLDGGPTEAGVRSAHLKQPTEQLLAAARASARQALAAGVTLVRDAGDRHGINNRLREEALDPARGLPRVRSAGIGMKRAGRYGGFMATDVDDAESIVRQVGELAVTSDEIKLILTGIIDFEAGAVTDEPQFGLEEVRLAVATARARGRKILVHCSGAKGLAIAARAGVASIEHGYFMDREILARMRDAGVAWTPTFCPVHFQWAHPEAVGWSAQTVGRLRRILDEHARHLVLAHEMGVRLLLGTDAGSMGVEHGPALADEMARYLEAGLPLAAVLSAATATPRRHFDLDTPILGRGAVFDALLLSGSPFADPESLRRPLTAWPAPAPTS